MKTRLLLLAALLLDASWTRPKSSAKASCSTIPWWACRSDNRPCWTS